MPHTLSIIIEDEGFASFRVFCHETGAGRPCGSYTERDWPDAITCRCSDISDQPQCEACAEGYHDECEYGEYVPDLGPSCRLQPLDECWYEHAVGELGSEILEFGKGTFELRVPVNLRGGSWEEPIKVSLITEAT